MTPAQQYRITYLNEQLQEETILCGHRVAEWLATYLADLPGTENVVVFDGHHGTRYHRHGAKSPAHYYLFSSPDQYGQVNLAVEWVALNGEKTYVTISIPFAELQRLVTQYEGTPR